MKSPVADALADAFEHHKRGRLSEAEAGYRQVLQTTPDEPDALHRLGIIAHQLGRNELALQLIDRATAVNPAHPTYHHDAGIVLHALGQIDDAIARYRKALMLQPRYPKAHNGVGIALKDQGRLEEAAASFRAAVSLKPDYIEALNNLGNVLRDLEHPAEATRIYQKALELSSGSAYLWANVGSALRDLGAFGSAVEACRRALALQPDLADVRSNLGDALFALGQPDEAAANYACALRARETPESIAGFVRSFAAAKLRCVDADVRAIAIRAISVPWSRPARLAMACIRAVANRPEIHACIDRAWRAWPLRLTSQQLFCDIGPDVVFDELLLRTLLESAPVCDLQMERFLTMVRHAILDDVTREMGPESVPRLAFACALARQCFVNDYVYSHTAAEIDQARALRDRLAASLCRGDVPSALTIAIVCAYFPLLSIVGAESLGRRGWPAPVAALFEQQLREPLEERVLRDRIPRLTTLDDEVSIGVRRQYEEHPYPKWVKLPRSGPIGFDGRDPAAGRRRLQSNEQTQHDILIAGCGTGQESIEFANAFPRARVLAVDLSLASLAYAERKTRELEISNVEYAQADILTLGSLSRTFDVISSVGVLHHLADPSRGWRSLVSMLAPGGYMLIGLYSERGRRDVAAAKHFITQRGYAATDADIRSCRQELLSGEHGDQFAMLASRSDFYTIAECRDLLFHVQERRVTVPEIVGLLDAFGLRFDGFLLSEEIATRYRELYPGDPAMDNLDNWNSFEAAFPYAFSGMYIFWVQKRVEMPVGSSYPVSHVTDS